MAQNVCAVVYLIFNKRFSRYNNSKCNQKSNLTNYFIVPLTIICNEFTLLYCNPNTFWRIFDILTWIDLSVSPKTGVLSTLHRLFGSCHLALFIFTRCQESIQLFQAMLMRLGCIISGWIAVPAHNVSDIIRPTHVAHYAIICVLMPFGSDLFRERTTAFCMWLVAFCIAIAAFCKAIFTWAIFWCCRYCSLVQAPYLSDSNFFSRNGSGRYFNQRQLPRFDQ